MKSVLMMHCVIKFPSASFPSMVEWTRYCGGHAERMYSLWANLCQLVLGGTDGKILPITMDVIVLLSSNYGSIASTCCPTGSASTGHLPFGRILVSNSTPAASGPVLRCASSAVSLKSSVGFSIRPSFVFLKLISRFFVFSLH